MESPEVFVFRLARTICFREVEDPDRLSSRSQPGLDVEQAAALIRERDAAIRADEKRKLEAAPTAPIGSW